MFNNSRRWRKPYSLPPHLQKRSKESKSTPLVQPEWDDTIHDLTAFRASPEDVLRRKLSRTSHNQMGIALMQTQSRRSCQSARQQQQRYSGSVSGGEEDSADEYDTGHSHADHQRGPLSAQQQAGQQDHMRQQQQQQQQATSVLRQYPCSSTADSAQDDVCQWQSPTQPTLQQRHALQDIGNSRQHNTASGGPMRSRSAWQQQQQLPQQWGEQLRSSGNSTVVSVDAETLQALLDKVSLLEEQLQQQPRRSQLQQQLAQSTEQLAATQQELSKLQQEHRQYVAHSTTILTQLQTQVQKLLTGQHAIAPLPLVSDLMQQRQQQQEAAPYSRLLQPPAAAGSQHELPGAGAVAAAPQSSAGGLMQASNLIRHQLQLQQQEIGAQQPKASSAAAATAAAGTTATTSPAAERVMAPIAAAARGGSPSRTKAALHFTPVDELPLPSYATMQQRNRGMPAAAAAAAAGPAKQDTIGRLRAGLEAAAAAVEAGRRDRHTARPHTQQVSEAVPAGGLVHQQHRPAAGAGEAAAGGDGGGSSGLPSLWVRAPAGAEAAAAVWEAELSSPHPEQMQVPGEEAHYHLSNAAAESFVEAPAASASVAAAVSSELAALLRDLGLGSLCSDSGGVAALPGCPADPSFPGNSSGSAGAPPKADAAAAAGKVVLSEAAAAPTAATAPGTLDVDWGLQGGLPQSAVSRVYTAAGCVAGSADAPKPRVLPAELRSNVCFRDHLLAAQAAAGKKG